MLFLYYGYLFSLAMWTSLSITGRTEAGIRVYIIYLVVMTILGMVICLTVRKSKQIRAGLMIVFVLSQLGASIAYRTSDIYIQEYLHDTILTIGASFLVYVFIKYTKLYQTKLFNGMCIIGSIMTLLGARIVGRPIYGSYMYFCGILIFGLVLMQFPFAMAYFMAKPETNYRKGNVMNLSWNMMQLLGCAFVLFIGCAICNEFGLLLILGLTVTVAFFIRCKNSYTKLIYSSACIVGVVATCKFIPHVKDRVEIWLNPVSAFENSHLAAKAESVLYLFRNYKRIGWYGIGIGSLPKSIYPTLNTDHVLVTLINDYSVVVAVTSIVLGVMLVRYMLADGKRLNTYDRYLNLSCAVIVALIIAINIASSLGSFITAGIGFPWISNGGSVNLMLSVLVAIHCGLIGRRSVS